MGQEVKSQEQQKIRQAQEEQQKIRQNAQSWTPNRYS
jgi:hypothetical protein